MSPSPTPASVPTQKPGSAPSIPPTQFHLLAELIEQLPDAVLFMDSEFRITYANAHSRSLSRLTPADFHTKTLWQIFPNTIGTDLELHSRRAHTEQISKHFDYYYEPFDIWVHIHVSPIEKGVALYYRDITSYKRAEAARDEAVRRFQLVFESAPDSILCIDRDWNCTFANRAAHDILKSDGLVGTNLWTAFPLNQSEPFASNYRATMEHSIPTEFEAYYPAPLNIWFKVFARPFDDGIIIFSSDITDRKKAEARRDATTRQLEQVFDATIDGVISLSRDWTYTFLNRRAQELLAVKGDLIGKNLWEEFPAAKTGNVSYFYTRAMEQRIPGEFETFYPDPLNLWLNIRCCPSDDGIVVFFRDITAQRQNIEELAASEERYRVLADLNPQAIWMGAADGQITYANQGFLDYIGFTMEQASSGLGWLEAFHKEEHPRVIEAWTRSVTTGVEYDIEARMIRASDKAVRWWWLRALPVRDDAGKILNWLGVANEIHDRKTHAEELYLQNLETERQRAELETLYATAPIGLALFDPVEFRYLRLNQRQAAFFGLPPSEILGKTLTEMAPIPGLRELFEEVRDGRPVINHVLEGKLATDPPDVHRFWTVNYLPVYGTDGEVQAISAASLEITHQKKSEAALIQSEKLAAVGRLASSISHEINNPLEAITNILYLIELDQTIPETIRPLVSMAQSELSRVCQIATQTLRFHRQAVRATHVVAQNLVGAVLNLYQGRLANTGISVEADYASNTPILCFENDIRQVLNNLIANAIDAMRQNGGRLVIRAHDTNFCEPGNPSTHPVRAVRITIADTGHGMTPQVRARIFEPFFTTKDLNGTGLGLWISSGIVARHKGRLTLRSSTNPAHHGTVFSLTLPVDDQPALPR